MGITVLELLRLENAKTVIPSHPVKGAGGCGKQKMRGITVLELLRLENAKMVIPRIGWGGGAWGKQNMRGNHRFGAFEA